ncbi:cell wall protein DAN4-like [Poecilia reticulata]|uniref:cell wall protein DAN4-like n=1 Tax=Poecilia reticulata TaxID=8081 RepID=UPI0004A2FCB8|nr:PREDICTED: cell wall protein DAN4-like [Poecilia reticulata]
MIYRKKFGLLFIRSFVIAFRSSQRFFLRMNSTEAEVGLEFNKTTSAEILPKNEDVQQTLVEAINSTTFNVTFIPSTISLIKTPLATAAPTTNTTTTTTTTPTTNTTTTTKPTTTTTTTVESIVTKRLTFRSAGEIFTNDLLITSSTAFKNRAELLKTHLLPLYQAAFSSFRSFIVISFSNGSIINNIGLEFATASQPSNTQIRDVLVKANSTVTAFNIDITSIFVDGTQTSSGVSHTISLITAFSLVLLSWLLSTQQ